MTLLELAERCEKVSGPNRSLDVLVGCAVGYVPDQPGCEWAKADHWQYVPVPKISGRIGCADKAGNVAAHWEAPAYSTSLDAAMSLVLEGHQFTRLSVPQDSESSAEFVAAVCYTDELDETEYAFGEAATPVLAMCAAALRARAAQAGVTEGGVATEIAAPVA